MLEPGELNNLFIQTHHLHYRRAHSRFSEYGLGEGQPKLLRVLENEDGLSQVELARRCSLEPATITAALARMEKAGLVERKPDPADQRVLRVWIAPAGWRLSAELKQLFFVLEEESFAGFSPEERAQLAGYLTRMYENLRRAGERDA